MKLLNPINWFKNCAPQSGIAQRIVWCVLIFSLFSSIITGAATGFFDYKKELAALEQNFATIEHVQFPAIIENVCSKNTALLFKQAWAIKNIPHIEHVTISDGQNELAFAGAIAGRQLIGRNYPITCFYDKTTRITGMLTVTASADGIVAAVMKSFFRTLIRDALSTLLLALAILLLVNHFFKRHINEIVSYIQSLSPQQMDAPCVLQRRHSKTPDELDRLAAAINGLRCKLLECYTQLHEKEHEMRNTESVLMHVLNAIPISIFWKDINGCYLGCNQNFASLIGLDIPAQIVSKTDFDLPFTAAEAAAFQIIDRAVIEDNRPHQVVDLLQAPGGRRLWIEMTKAPLTDASGTVYGILGVGIDITER